MLYANNISFFFRTYMCARVVAKKGGRAYTVGSPGDIVVRAYCSYRAVNCGGRSLKGKRANNSRARARQQCRPVESTAPYINRTRTTYANGVNHICGNFRWPNVVSFRRAVSSIILRAVAAIFTRECQPVHHHHHHHHQ